MKKDFNDFIENLESELSNIKNKCDGVVDVGEELDSIADIIENIESEFTDLECDVETERDRAEEAEDKLEDVEEEYPEGVFSCFGNDEILLVESKNLLDDQIVKEFALAIGTGCLKELLQTLENFTMSKNAHHLPIKI